MLFWDCCPGGLKRVCNATAMGPSLMFSSKRVGNSMKDIDDKVKSGGDDAAPLLPHSGSQPVPRHI